MKMEHTTTMEATLAYAARGWAVLPLKPDNTPLTSNGVEDATTRPEIIEYWWKRWTDANVAIATGERSGIVVVDVDWGNGGNDTLEELQIEVRSLPEPSFKSTGDRLHYYFEHDGAYESFPLDEGIYIRADGDYVVAPPSTQLNGNQSWVNVRGRRVLTIDEWIDGISYWSDDPPYPRPMCSDRLHYLRGLYERRG